MSDPISRLNKALEGRYRIERELGAGGMAIVYLADDLRHDRKVALKVLRPELAAIVGADRFLSEIKTTANLQHPHILPLFDSGEADGFLFYVMPFVDGETLRDRLDREHQLPVDEAVRIATGVAGALDYAHRRGIIHRDIKPANVLIHDGQPVVSDFGIALAVSAAGGGRMTETGLSLGTPHYMSPEQASADRDLSARSDVYSLGCVLYEMLAGQPPHTGPSAQSILVHILTEEPTPLGKLRQTVPPNVAAAVAKAIEKLPADRFESAADFRGALEDAGFTYEGAHVTSPVPGIGRPPPRRSRGAGLAWAAAAAATAVALWGWLRPEPTEPIRRFRLEVELGEYEGRRAAISPDGSRIVFVGPDRQLYQRSLDVLEALPIAGAQPARDPFFSPDGAYVGFNYGPTDTDQIATVSLAGGTPVRLGGPANVALGGVWLRDGFVYFVGGGSPDEPEVGGLFRASAQGGPVELVETDAPVVRPAAIGDRTDRLLVVDRVDQAGVGVLDIASGAVEPVPGLEEASDVSYAGGFVFWVTSGGELATARFDEAAALLTSLPVTLAQGVLPAGFHVSESGMLVYMTGTAPSGAFPAWVDREGEATPLDAALGDMASAFDDVRLSADGRYAAIEIRRASGPGRAIAPDEERQVVIYDLDQGSFFQLTVEGRFNESPRWLPDGRVAYVTARSGRNGIWAQRFDRTGVEAPLVDTDLEISGFDVSPDPGAPMAVTLSSVRDTSFLDGIYLVDPGGGQPRAFVATRAVEDGPAISPDGRWLAYYSDESGLPASEVYVRAFPGGGRPWPISVGGGRAPAWSADGTALFYYTRSGLMVAELELEEEVRVVSRALALDGNYQLSSRSGARYDVGADGRVLAVVEPRAGVGVDSARPVLVLNVFEEIRRRLGED